MPAPPTWPPPPDVPHPLAEHDGFLTACVLNSPTKPILTRLRLVRKLHKEQGLDFRQSIAIVNDYCDRQAIMMPLRGLEYWFRLSVAIVMLAASLMVFGNLWFFVRGFAAAATDTEKTVILTEETNMLFVCVGFAFVSACLALIFAVRLSRKRCIDAEDARKKLAA